MSSKQTKATRHFCEGKKMTRKDSVILTEVDGKKEGRQFASVRLAKFFMRTGKEKK